MGPLRNCNPVGQPTCKKNKKIGLVQKCKPSSPTEDSSLRSPNKKKKPKAEARQREWAAFQKKKTGVTSLILDTFFVLIHYWPFDYLNCFCLYLLQSSQTWTVFAHTSSTNIFFLIHSVRSCYCMQWGTAIFPFALVSLH